MSHDSAATPAERDARILRERARLLARVQRRSPDVMLEVLEFRLAHERYALASALVREVTPLTELTPLPCTPPFIAGIVNVRGLIVPVLDLKKFFDLPEQGLTDLHCVIFVRAGEIEIGLLADAITGVRAIPLKSLQEAPLTHTGIRADCLKGVTAERVIVLDAEAILLDPRIVVNEEVE